MVPLIMAKVVSMHMEAPQQKLFSNQAEGSTSHKLCRAFVLIDQLYGKPKQ